MPAVLTRFIFATAVVAASVLVHLGLFGVIVLAERRGLAPAESETIDVELVKPNEIPQSKSEPPKSEPSKVAEQKPVEPMPVEQKPKLELPTQAAAPEAPKPAPQSPPPPVRAAKASPQDQPQPEEPPLREKPAKPEGPSGGPPSESKSKLTPEEIAALRAQVQKCWQLPVGIPGMLNLEVVIRVHFGPRGQILGEPDLLKAPASERGPILVKIAMTALKECMPYRMPPAKYADWKVLDLRFLATGMTGLGVVERPPLAKR